MESNGNIHAIVVDLDRTLLHTDKSLSPYTVAVLKACRDSGIKVMVATARPLRTAKQYCEQIGAAAMVISNGARVICGDRLTEHRIRRQSAVRLLEALSGDPSLCVTLETGDVAYSNMPVADYETVISGDLPAITRTESVVKILVRFDGEQTLRTVESAISQELYCTVANHRLIQIMDRTATKWRGIQTMLAQENCAAAQTAYFGDDYDDIEPLRLCGMGVAVANGITEAKAAADHIAESCDADGVARFIEKVLLQKPIADMP